VDGQTDMLRKLRKLVSGFLMPRPVFKPRSAPLKFFYEQRDIGDWPFPEHFGFPLLVSFYQCSINSSVTEAM